MSKAADVLLDTAEAHLTYIDPDDFLASWTGTLLELVHAELAAQRSGHPRTTLSARPQDSPAEGHPAT